MLRNLTISLIALGFGLGLEAHAQTAVVPQPGAGQPDREVTRTEFGDWTRVCVEGTDECALEQVGKTAQGENALYFQVQKLPEPQTVDGVRIESVAVIRVPLNVILTNQLRLRIDQGEQSASPFFICNQQGCVVQAPLRPEQLEAFRRGARAEFAYTLMQNGQVGDVEVAISLSGFTRGYESL